MKRRNFFKSQDGFTLIEVIAAALIMGFLLVTITSVFLMSQKVYSRGGDISYKHKSITNIETDLQNALATATDVKIQSTSEGVGAVYSLGFNNNGDCVEVINGVEYQTDQITEISLSSSGNTLNYEMVPKDSMSTLSGGIVMNNIKNKSIYTTLNAGNKGFLVITQVN